MSLDKERGRHLLSSLSVVEKLLDQVDLAELDRLYSLVGVIADASLST